MRIMTETEHSGMVTAYWREQTEKRFSYHPPFGDQAKRYEALRAKAREFASLLIDMCPDSGERSIAMGRLQEAVMWANASIAINERESRSEVLEVTDEGTFGVIKETHE